jgi:arabinofuranan 3-O-arabinosyltransferase
MAYDGDPTTSWLATPLDDHPTITLSWDKPRTIDSLRVSRPAAPGVMPARAVLKAARGEIRAVDLRGSGAFRPVRTKKVTIAFSRSGPRTWTTLGVGDIYLGEKPRFAPLVGAEPTGAVCGWGPELEVDGTLRPTRVEGLIGDVIAAGTLTVRLCGSDQIKLNKGTHRVRLISNDQFEPVSLDVRHDNPFGTTRTMSRTVTVRSNDIDHAVVDVSKGEDAILSTPGTFNVGWVATLDGHTLTPIQVDGWSQGWRIPADQAGRVTVTFEPQQRYRITLVASLVLLAITVLAALVALVRHRRRSALPEPEPTPQKLRPRWLRWAGVVSLVVLVGLVGGPVACVAAVLAVALRSIPWLAITLATVLLIVGVVIDGVVVADGPAMPSDLADLFVAAGWALVFVTVVLLPRPLSQDAAPRTVR